MTTPDGRHLYTLEVSIVFSIYLERIYDVKLLTFTPRAKVLDDVVLRSGTCRYLRRVFNVRALE